MALLLPVSGGRQNDHDTGSAEIAAEPLARSGVPGLDDILCGGFTARRLYLSRAFRAPGKTTLALQFLMEGVRQGERVCT
jgi:circadian clock protein KaiC